MDILTYLKDWYERDPFGFVFMGLLVAGLMPRWIWIGATIFFLIAQGTYEAGWFR